MKTDFELSKMLKKLGYDGVSTLAYDENGVVFSGGNFNWNINNDTYTCVDLLEALVFLINKHNIYVKINLSAFDDNSDMFWYYDILKTQFNSRATGYTYEYFDVYVDALTNGLKKACEYLIKNK